MPRCKNCKIKFEAKHFNQKFCLEQDCVKACVEYTINQRKKIEKKKWNKEKARRKANLQTLPELMKLAQTHFNRFIRLRDAINNQPCISCGKALRKDNTDAGHYYSAGGHFNTKYNEDNCHAQCSRPCNKDKHGDLLNYQIGLEKRIGGAKMLELHVLAHKEKKFTHDELRAIANKYKDKYNELKKSLK